MSGQHAPRIYQEALGIHTGDIVRTDYGSGPYEVWSLTPPTYRHDEQLEVIVRLWPVVSLACVNAGEQPKWGSDCPFSLINDVRQGIMPGGDIRWFTDQNDEIVVTAPEHPTALPVDMFGSYPPAPVPPIWQPGVDYTLRGDGHLHVWNCQRCARDFNSGPNPAWSRVAVCPRCGWRLTRPIFVMPRAAGLSSFTLALDNGRVSDWHIRKPRLDERAVGEVDMPAFAPVESAVSK